LSTDDVGLERRRLAVGVCSHWLAKTAAPLGDVYDIGVIG